jgi:hypothetical protein
MPFPDRALRLPSSVGDVGQQGTFRTHLLRTQGVYNLLSVANDGVDDLVLVADVDRLGCAIEFLPNSMTNLLDDFGAESLSLALAVAS